MGDLKTETIKVLALLDKIEANPEIFDKLGNAKIEPALMAYQCNSLENLAHSIGGLDKTLKILINRLNTKSLKVLFQDVGKGI